MEQRLQNNLADLAKYNCERKLWLLMSSLVVFAILGILFEWNDIRQNKLEWILAGGGFIIAVGWWYWTMTVVRSLIQHKAEEYQVLSEVIVEIKDIKKEIREILIEPLDKDN